MAGRSWNDTLAAQANATLGSGRIMRMSLKSVLNLVVGLASLVMISAALAQEPKSDPAKVKFLLMSCADGFNFSPPQVNGIVARGIDLSEDATAKQLLQMGLTFGQEQCPSIAHLVVRLKPGDPTIYTNPDGCANFGAEREAHCFGVSSTGRSPDIVSLVWEAKVGIVRYDNDPKTIKEAQIANAAQAAAQAKQREALLAQQRQAAQRARSEIAARSAAFVKANGIAHFVTRGIRESSGRRMVTRE
jgi:hypothetical protein